MSQQVIGFWIEWNSIKALDVVVLEVSMATPSCAFLLLLVVTFAQQSLTHQESSSTKPLSQEEIAQLHAKAEAGDPRAQLDLGRAYDDGNGLPQNDQQAAKWYRSAAEQGNAAAQNNLGIMFRSGRGVDKDKVEALKWYKKAARQKNPSGMFNLGAAYYNGDGVPIDDVIAYTWFLLAQDFGSQSAVDAVKRMNADKGSLEVEALEKAGDMFWKNDDMPRSYSDAIHWYRKAADRGSTSAQVALAGVLLQGPDAESTYPEVHQLCEKAAGVRYAPGAYCLGVLYQHGRGVTQDLRLAARWFGEAADLGNTPAMLRLGEMYRKGDGVKQDKIAAYEFVFLADASDLAEAKQEKATLEKELTPTEVKKAKARATKWAGQHNQYGPLKLRGKMTTVN
ncbi:MAG: tetratricopeptide repeat protein [Terriglobales bacterium]